jgi:hypothetical protein
MARGQELDAIHLRHAVIDQEQSQRIALLPKPIEEFQCGGSGIGRKDAIARRVLAPQIALDGL